MSLLLLVVYHILLILITCCIVINVKRFKNVRRNLKRDIVRNVILMCVLLVYDSFFSNGYKLQKIMLVYVLIIGLVGLVLVYALWLKNSLKSQDLTFAELIIDLVRFFIFSLIVKDFSIILSYFFLFAQFTSIMQNNFFQYLLNFFIL